MQPVVDPELVIGIVGRMGVDTGTVFKWLETELHKLHYTSHRIKLTDLIKNGGFGFDLKSEPIEDRYTTYIEACNKVREDTQLDEFFISYAVERIRNVRREEMQDDGAVPLRRTAYVIDQIKRPEEADKLRRIYGQQFILVSCHMPRDRLKSTFATKIAEGHADNPKSLAWEGEATKLILRDEKETSVPHGQRVSDVFPLADLIIDVSDQKSGPALINRFFEALFGNFSISPTKHEFYQNIAYQVALTSCDTARQVGAAISRGADILTTGYNEAPKSGGGTYWSDEGIDGRDIALGKDQNTIRKRQMIVDLIKRLGEASELKRNSIDDHQIVEVFIDGINAPLKKSQIMDTLEYGRAVHAEMAAIATAARIGVRLENSILHCTTFPCHNCSKHIVAAGITEVFYVEPYAKSFTDDLYPDSIVIDRSEVNTDKVHFRQFIGITPVRYRYLFAKDGLKDSKGNIKEWVARTAQPILEKLDQGHTQREVLFQKWIAEKVAPDGQRYLGN